MISQITKVRKALRIKMNEYKNNLNYLPKADTKAVGEPPSSRFKSKQEVCNKATRNGRPQHPAKPVRGIRPTKKREGVAKGRESATELLAPLIFCMRPCETGYQRRSL